MKPSPQNSDGGEGDDLVVESKSDKDESGEPADDKKDEGGESNVEELPPKNPDGGEDAHLGE